MSNLPITSRIKRSPLLRSDDPPTDKPTDPIDPKAKAYGSEEGEDKEITIKKESAFEGPKMSDEEWAKLPAAEKRRLNAAAGANKEGKIITNTTKIEKGEDLNYDTDLYKKKKGDVLEPWEKRRMSRGIKKEQRDIRRAKQKLARAEKRGNTIKADEAKAELEEFQAMAGRGKSARATGYATGKRDVQTGQEKMLKGDQPREQQLEQAKETAKREQAKKADKAKKKSISTGSDFKQSEGSVDPVSATVFSDFGKDLSNEDYNLDYSSAFQMKAKSPAAKKLQGNQGRLPQHLQDAVSQAPESPAKLGPLAVMAGKAIIGGLVNKAMSSNKMKSSGFKMKGYGKK